MTRRAVVAVTASSVLAAVVAAAPPAPASPVTGSRAVVAPALLDAAAVGPAPAVLTWDRRVTDADAVRAHLEAADVDATVLDGLPVAFACAGGLGDVELLARVPGALSVWGEEELEPAGHAVAEATGAPALPELGVDGTGLSLAVVDTGVDGRHQELAGDLRSNVRVLVSHREVLGPGDPPPCQDLYTAELTDSEVASGHGTHLAGVAAGTGVAPQARIVGVGVSDAVTVDTDVRDSTRLSMFGALAGLNHALLAGLETDHPVKSVLGGWAGKGLQNPFHPISLGIRDLHDFGITVVLPIGNGGPAASDCSAAATCTVSPYAVGGFAVGVAATSASDSTRLASFSSRGDQTPRTSEGLPVVYEPLLSAPGEGVLGPRRVGTANVATAPTGPSAGGGTPTAPSTDPHHVAMSGTSVAAAHVAGAVVLMQEAAYRSTGCYLPTAEVRRLLAETAAPMAHPRHEAGAGSLDVAAAVAAARAAVPPKPNDRFLCPRPGGS
ncbi:MAG TPA: S8 family serine peptidase [Mycobacteriales bacterium]|nr:S8 family serine peptidase [Mycobacteriales bacterium]